MRATRKPYPCGHPRTVQNTRSVGVAGVRCKICRQKIDERYKAKKKQREESPNG